MSVKVSDFSSSSLPEPPLTSFLGLGTWISPPHEDAFRPGDFLQDVNDGMAAAAVLLQEDDVPMPWEHDVCQYHKHDFTVKCERKIQGTAAITGASTPVVRGRGKQYACPDAEEYGCSETYASKQSATRHSRTAHRRVVKRKTDKAVVVSNSTAVDYGGEERFACPDEEQNGRGETFSRQEDAEMHNLIVHHAHLAPRYACPHAEQFGCSKTFTGKQGAAGHSRVHGMPGKKRR